jgi:integrase
VAKKNGQGQGTVFQSEGRWCAMISLGRDENGKRKRRAFWGHTAAEVQEKLLKARSDQANGIVVNTEKQNVKDLLTAWLSSVAKVSVRPRTYERYEQLINRHIVPTLGDIRLEKLLPQHVQQMLNKKSSEGLAPKTVRHIRGVLTTALGRAVKWGLVYRNAAALSDAPHAVRHEIRAFTSDEAQRFIRAVEGQRHEALYLLTITLGLRRGEVLGLRWQDVDLDARTIHIRHGLQRVGGKLTLSETKTMRSRRTLPLLDFVAKALRSHRARQNEQRLRAGEEWQDLGYVFATRLGTPIDPANLLDDFKRILADEDAKLPSIRFMTSGTAPPACCSRLTCTRAS